VANFKHFRKTVKNQNSIQEDVMHRLILGNASYHSVQNHSSFLHLPETQKIKIYKTIILSAV